MLFELTALSQEHAQLLNLIFIKAVIILTTLSSIDTTQQKYIYFYLTSTYFLIS